MRHAILFALVVCSALFLVASVTARPQGKARCTLSGVVLGPEDKPVAHASVTYQSSGGHGPHAVYTDAKGRFNITKLRADNYDLRASAKGIFSEWEKNVALGPGETMFVSLRLIYSREVLKPSSGKPAKP
jgi:hypothetical protein